jgi:hypothetical protein
MSITEYKKLIDASTEIIFKQSINLYDESSALDSA